MADNSILGAMDHLWFHHVILLSEPSSLKPLLAASKSLSSTHNSHSYPSSASEDENTLLDVDTIATKQDDQYCDERESKKQTSSTRIERERPTRLNPIAGKSRPHSTSPSSQKRSIRLQKTMSCKSLCELELEEVKGFMDLGFRFKKDHLSKRMMSVIPGLQRLELFKTEEKHIIANSEGVGVDDGTEEEDEEEERDSIVRRPYLSEAWLIKRPDSPLLNLRIPRVSTVADMKKHLKYWAKTVASAIRQES